jgi:hypothetical protein
MNYDEIQQQYAKVMGRITNDLYHGGIERLRNDAGISPDERQHRAWNLYDQARDMAREATAERNERLAERERVLHRKLFGAPSGGLVPTDGHAKAAFTDAIGRAAVADDEALERMAAAAEHTGDSTLAKAVFAESHRRERGDLMQTYLQRYDDAREAFGEFSEIPSAEERERSLERAPEAIPAPTFQQIAPTPQARLQEQQSNTITRPMGG